MLLHVSYGHVAKPDISLGGFLLRISPPPCGLAPLHVTTHLHFLYSASFMVTYNQELGICYRNTSPLPTQAQNKDARQ